MRHPLDHRGPTVRVLKIGKPGCQKSSNGEDCAALVEHSFQAVAGTVERPRSRRLGSFRSPTGRHHTLAARVAVLIAWGWVDQAKGRAMPSPFPGMNPYFEQPAVWSDFHTEFLTTLRRQLAPQVAPRYFVQIEQHIYIHDLPPEPRRLVGRADVSVSRPQGAAAGVAGVGLLEAPAEVRLPAQDVEEVPYLEVRDRAGRELVTVVELLSPSNKRPGPDREAYLAKRRELLRGPTHLVEIDLLRGGPPMPLEARPEGDYSVLVCRAGQRPAAGYWPVRLRDPLPVVPIPLRPPEPDARVDLQDVLHRTYDGPGYESFIYDGAPEPPLSSEDASWAERLVPRGG